MLELEWGDGRICALLLFNHSASRVVEILGDRGIDTLDEITLALVNSSESRQSRHFIVEKCAFQV